LFGLALCAPKYYSSELEGLNGDQPQEDGERVNAEKVRDESERRRLGEQLGRRVESEETPRREAIVILRPATASESELYNGQDQSAAPGVLLPHHTRSHRLAARFAVRRVQDVQVIPVRVQEQPQEQQEQQSGEEEETTTPEPLITTTTTEEPSTTTEEESTTSSTEEPSPSSSTEPQFSSDASAVVNSRTFTTFKARKNVNGKEVTVLGRSMAFKSSAMNVLRPTKHDDENDRKDETDEERQEREKAENVKIVQFSQMQTIRSSKAVITRDV